MLSMFSSKDIFMNERKKAIFSYKNHMFLDISELFYWHQNIIENGFSCK